ncbi:MAG: winged helix-turn-helix transcriptional regulator [Solirubrobacterales bacterium]
MPGNTVNGSGSRARSGAQTLVLLAAPLNVDILRSLADGPKQQAELRRATGSAQTTLRAQLRRLVEIGVIDKNRRNRFPGALEYELTDMGKDLIFVATVLERWLDATPDGSLPIGSNAAKAAIKALTEAWSTTMLRALAAGPLSLTELDRVIGSLSYPSLERRLAAMRLAGQIEARPGDGRGTPYGVTEWLRQGVGPLAAATRWERRHMPRETAPLTRIDAETVFLLAVPLLRLPAEATGRCRMAAEIPNGKGRLAGVTVGVEAGNVISCTTQLEDTPEAWALGPSAAWLGTVVDADVQQLEIGGDYGLARALLDSLHQELFGRGSARSRQVRP